jgi:hypothetical protein
MFLVGPLCAEDIVNDIDLEKVKWDYLCPNVGSIRFVQNGMECEVSHPASKFHSTKVHEYIAENFPSTNNCDHLKAEYEALTQPQGNKGDEWKLCYMVFKSALYDRLRHPEYYVHSTDEWIAVHFNKETMNQ